jgi:hypothetical protein
MDGPRREYEPLLVLLFFKSPHGFKSEMAFFAQLRRNPFRKIIFLGIFYTKLLGAFLVTAPL